LGGHEDASRTIFLNQERHTMVNVKMLLPIAGLILAGCAGPSPYMVASAEKECAANAAAFPSFADCLAGRIGPEHGHATYAHNLARLVESGAMYDAVAGLRYQIYSEQVKQARLAGIMATAAIWNSGMANMPAPTPPPAATPRPPITQTPALTARCMDIGGGMTNCSIR
jgi:hypothetical protein